MTVILEINIFIAVLAALIIIKSITVGSDFSIIKWMKYGNRYVDWYINRPQFDPNDKEE
jgi:hypothetical protein